MDHLLKSDIALNEEKYYLLKRDAAIIKEKYCLLKRDVAIIKEKYCFQEGDITYLDTYLATAPPQNIIITAAASASARA